MANTTFERNQAVRVTTPQGIVLDGTISETGPMGRPMPFYPDSTVTKYGNGTMGRTAWGYKVRMPILNKETLELHQDRHGQPLMGLGYVEASQIEAA